MTLKTYLSGDIKLLGIVAVVVQLDKVEVHELKPKMLAKDEGGLVWRQTSNQVTIILSIT